MFILLIFKLDILHIYFLEYVTILFYKYFTLKIENLIIVLTLPAKFPGRDYEVSNIYGRNIPYGIIIKMLSSLKLKLKRV